MVKAVDVSYHVFGNLWCLCRSRDSQSKLSFKDIPAQLSTFLVNHLGVPAIREGSLIRTKACKSNGGRSCSGIRSLIALIALGALMAYFSNLSRPKRAIILSLHPYSSGNQCFSHCRLGFDW